MARSKNLASYPDVYWDILEAMRGGIKEITFKLSQKEAINTQQTFYAFIRAMEYTSEKKLKAGDIKHSQELRRDAITMRGYLLTIDKSTAPATLHIVNRDLAPQTQALREQLKKQVNGISAEEVAIINPPKITLFDKPLEISDDGVSPAREKPTS